MDEDNCLFRSDAVAKGFADYPYCVVMEAATQSLRRIIDHEFIAGFDVHKKKEIFRDVTVCLKHMHDKYVIHGDIKGERMC